MRKGKRSRPSIQAWLFALAIPAVALFMVFSLMPYDRMVSPWPWGIGQGEVMAYQKVFDRRPGQHVEGNAEVYSLVASGQGQLILKTEKDEATAKQVDLTVNGSTMVPPGSFLLEFPEDRPFRGATVLAFVPADLHSLEALYAQAVADSLAIEAPPTALVQLERDGKKVGPYLVQERITPEYVMKHALVAMALVGEDGTVAKDDRTTAAAGDTIGTAASGALLSSERFDTTATAALGLLACAEQRTDLLDGEAGSMYDRVTRAITPLYRMRLGKVEGEPEGAVPTAFREALSTAANQQRIARLAERLRADSAAWTARFLTIDSAAVPVLAKGRNIGLVQAEVDRTRERFLQRLFHPATASFIGPPTDAPPQTPIALDPWLAQFRSDPDTIRFVRGKYDIDHDLVLPQGMAVVLERGARWFMAPGVSVVVNGELHMRGTDLNPVFIRPQVDGQPWGAIAVNGIGDTRVRIRGLRISGGSDLWAHGVRHGGMLSFIRADVRMDHCSIGETYGAAAVSMRRGNFAMADCYLAGTANGFVNLAEVIGSVERTGFGQPSRSGDAALRNAISLRASHVLVRGCTFADLPFTALRAGRSSEALVTASRFSGNAIAIMAVDGSSVHVDGCDFTGNGKVFVLHRDQAALGGATLSLYTNTFAGNGTQQEVDEASSVKTGTSIDPKVWRDLAGQAAH